MFITFEGPEGAGKSTLIQSLAVLLRSRGLSVTTTREPGGSPVAEKIRALILDHPMSPWTELFLYEAARAEHLAQTILPALTRGDVVLCDRFTDSTLAYQGHARGLTFKSVHAVNRVATGGLKPDLTVLVDIDPALGLKHAQDKNRFEAEGVAFHRKVRQGFLKARALAPTRWITIRARSGTPDKMAETLLKKIEPWLKRVKAKALRKKVK